MNPNIVKINAYNNCVVNAGKGGKMHVIVKSIKPFRSQVSGRDCFRIDGEHLNEFDEPVKGYTFIDPANNNSSDWLEVLETWHQNRGHNLIVSGIRMKNRDRGLWSADSRPRVEDVVPA